MNWSYLAYDARCSRILCTVAAESADAAADLLRQKGLFIVSVAAERGSVRTTCAADSSLVAAEAREASTQVSLDPPPWLELTTSEPSVRATRVSQPGSTQTR